MSSFGIGSRVPASISACLAALALSSCSVTASGGKAVDEAEVEKQIGDQLAANVGQRPKSVDCPDDLQAKQGTTMRCTLTDNADKKFGLTVTVTSVKDNTVNFTIKVDDQPAP